MIRRLDNDQTTCAASLLAEGNNSGVHQTMVKRIAITDSDIKAKTDQMWALLPDRPLCKWNNNHARFIQPLVLWYNRLYTH